MSSPRRIGLLGGSFDPIHLAHLALGRAARETLALDEVRFIPAGAPWQRSGLVASPAQRLAMARLAVEGEPGFAVDAREVERSGLTYTVDTLESLHRELPQARLWLILGGDQLANFGTWRDGPRILQLCTLAVAERPGAPIYPPEALAGIAIERIPMPPMDVSGTAIRARLARGEDVTGLLPQKVLDYIRRAGLYTKGWDSSPR